MHGYPARGGVSGCVAGLEHLHLITYTLQSETRRDHGPVFFRGAGGQYPTYVNSLAVGKDGYIYSIGRTDHESGRADMFRVKVPT